jgi:hypothetical protein
MITQYGISWLFDGQYEYGQFINGDYWVQGPATIVEINPGSRPFYGRTKNGSMVNPSPVMGNNQGYDSTCPYLTYDESLNAALNLSSSRPLTLEAGSALVSTISMDAAGVVPQIRSAAVLTVLAGPPPEGSFRPPYSGDDRSTFYTIAMVAPNRFRLKQLPRPDNTPSMATVERSFQRPWIDHIAGWTSRMIHPADNMPDYGREISRQVGIGALMLHLDFTESEKETLLVRYLQLGIDLYRNLQLGNPHWPGGGSHGSGRKWPILFTGIMLGDPGMQNIGAVSGNYLYEDPGYGPGNPPPDYILFGEEGQTFYVTGSDVTRTNSPQWRPDRRNGTPGPYAADDIGVPEWGIHHAVDPYQDNRDWEAIYRQCCSAIAWQGFILAARIMEHDSGAKTLWNHDALFDYVDRYMAVTADPDHEPFWKSLHPFIESIWGTHPGWRSWDGFSETMWDTCRGDY